MARNLERPDPPYMQVVSQIREQIRSGELREGDMVPSARQITKDWGISLATATKVLGALRAEGLARGVPGIGTVVVRSTATGSDLLLSIKQTGRIYAPDEHARIVSAEVVDAPDPIADALGVAPGGRVVRRQRVTLRGEKPVSLSTSWFDGALVEMAPKLAVTDRLRGGTPKYIEECTGRVVASGRDLLGARLATVDDATALDLEVGAAVLFGQNWFFDESGSVIEYGEYVSAGDRLRSYEYKVGE